MPDGPKVDLGRRAKGLAEGNAACQRRGLSRHRLADADHRPRTVSRRATTRPTPTASGTKARSSWIGSKTNGLERNTILMCGDRHWQYHSIDKRNGRAVHEFSCGPTCDEHVQEVAAACSRRRPSLCGQSRRILDGRYQPDRTLSFQFTRKRATAVPQDVRAMTPSQVPRSPLDPTSVVSTAGRNLVLVVAFLAGFFAGVHMSITSLAMRAASIQLMRADGTLATENTTLTNTLAANGSPGISARLVWGSHGRISLRLVGRPPGPLEGHGGEHPVLLGAVGSRLLLPGSLAISGSVGFLACLGIGACGPTEWPWYPRSGRVYRGRSSPV